MSKRYVAWQEGIPDPTKSGGPWFVSVPDGGDIEIGYDANGMPDEYHARLFADAGNAALPSDGRLSAEDREAMDQVYISHLKKEIERLRNASLPSDQRGTE